jgi:lysyl-tRNA synthetase class 2
VIALLTGLLGLVDIVSAVTPERSRRITELTRDLPVSVVHAASAGAVIAGILLIMLAHGLRRRKRRAWRAAVVLLIASSVLHIAKGLDVEEAVGTLVLAVIIVLLHREFYAAGDPRTRWSAPVALATMFILSCVLGMIMLFAQGVQGAPSLWSRFREVLYGLVGLSGPLHYTRDSTADVVFFILLGLGLATVLLPTYLLLRSPEPNARLTAVDEDRLRGLLTTHGARDSLAYFALRGDKAAVFSPTGKAAISYRVVSGVMLASGDPIGDPEAWPGAIQCFLRTAAEHAWVPAVVGCSERGGEVWVRDAGLRALELGDEAVIEVCEFTVDGRSMRNVRQTANRVRRLGYDTRVTRVGDLALADVQAIRTQAAAWRGADVERGFSMALGRFGDHRDPACVVVTAYRNARLQAVLHFVPWGDSGLSLDTMRRDHGADTGLNELMIVELLAQAPELGIGRVSLNFAVFRSTLERGERLGAGPVLRVWRSILIFASRWFQIESLYRFNAKFRPDWEPRFVCYPGARDLPRVALAALKAEAFIIGPRQWLQLRRPRALTRL